MNCKSVLWSVSIRFSSVWGLRIDSIFININLCQVLCAQASILELDHCLEVFVKVSLNISGQVEYDFTHCQCKHFGGKDR